MTNSKIFARDAIFISNQDTQDLVLKDTYDELLKNVYVKGNFLGHIIEREHNFPTGLSTKTLGKNLPNVAIPHTEGEFVNKHLIVPVSLKNPVVFNNMIKPQEKLEVKFLFMLLDTHPDGQAELLSQVMDFLAKTPEKELQNLFSFKDPDTIYEFLLQKF